MINPLWFAAGGFLLGLIVSPAMRQAVVEAPDVDRARQLFLPFASDAVGDVTRDSYGAMDWRSVLGQLPGLTEAVAMYYAMLDPQTSARAKLIISGALLYLVMPADVVPDEIVGVGRLDDAGVVFHAFKQVFSDIRPEHIAGAQQWLVSHGVQPKPIVEIGKPTEIVLPSPG